MFETSDKAEATKELIRINEDIEKSYSTFNTLRAIPTILCMEDAIGGLHIEYQRTRIAIENKSDPRHLGIINFIMEWYKFLDMMILNILKKGFLDCTTKLLDIGINIGVSIERDYKKDILNFINQLKEEKVVNKYITRIQERQFLGRYPGAMFIVVDGNTDKKIVQTIDKILDLRQLMYKKGLLRNYDLLSAKRHKN